MQNRVPFHIHLFRSPLFVGLILMNCLALNACRTSTAVQTAAATPTMSALGQRLEPLVEAQMQAMRVPGVVIFVQGPGSQSWAASLGTSNLAARAPMSSNMHFRIGSITKTFTGTVILQLVEEGKLKLDDPIGKYQPEVPNGNHITIQELLNMSSGLYDYYEDAGFEKAVEAEELGKNSNRVWKPKELLAIAFKHPPYFAPGKGYHYSDTNFILLGLVIEQLTGHAAEEEIQRRILTPLGLSNTSMPESSAIPNPYSHGYNFVPPFTQKNQPGGTSTSHLLDTTMINPWGWTAGAMISTVHDLQIWAKALATGKLLSTATQKERLNWISIPERPMNKSGLAIADFNGFLGHDGAVPGFQTFIGYMPEKSEMIVVLTNLERTLNNAAPADELAGLIMKNLT